MVLDKSDTSRSSPSLAEETKQNFHSAKRWVLGPLYTGDDLHETPYSLSTFTKETEETTKTFAMSQYNNDATL